MNVSAILIAYDGDEWLPACLDSLKNASTRTLHVVLIDNAGNTIIDGLDVSAFDAEVLSTPYPMGFAEANNFGLVQASRLEETVLFLNQDTISPRGWIDTCLETLDRNPRVAALTPVIRTYEDDDWDPSFLACLTEEQIEDLKEGRIHDDVIEAHHVPAASLFVRTDVILDTGPFDPIFGSYYEDYDLCRRIRERGYTVGFCTHARIRHFSGSSTNTRARELKRMRQIIRNTIHYELRESGRPRKLEALRRLFIDLPYRLGRGIVGTPSSQPPGVTLKAFLDLWRNRARVFSESHDQACWEAYLSEIGWPPERTVDAVQPAQEVESP